MADCDNKDVEVCISGDDVHLFIEKICDDLVSNRDVSDDTVCEFIHTMDLHEYPLDALHELIDAMVRGGRFDVLECMKNQYPDIDFDIYKSEQSEISMVLGLVARCSMTDIAPVGLKIRVSDATIV